MCASSARVQEAAPIAMGKTRARHTRAGSGNESGFAGPAVDRGSAICAMEQGSAWRTHSRRVPSGRAIRVRGAHETVSSLLDTLKIDPWVPVSPFPKFVLGLSDQSVDHYGYS